MNTNASGIVSNYRILARKSENAGTETFRAFPDQRWYAVEKMHLLTTEKGGSYPAELISIQVFDKDAGDYVTDEKALEAYTKRHGSPKEKAPVQAIDLSTSEGLLQAANIWGAAAKMSKKGGIDGTIRSQLVTESFTVFGALGVSPQEIVEQLKATWPEQFGNLKPRHQEPANA